MGNRQRHIVSALHERVIPDKRTHIIRRGAVTKRLGTQSHHLKEIGREFDSVRTGGHAVRVGGTIRRSSPCCYAGTTQYDRQAIDTPAREDVEENRTACRL